MASGDYEFFGEKQILTAYEARGVDIWAVFNAKRLIQKGCGLDELKKWLRMIGQSGTVAVYTLRVYEDAQAATDVKSNTPDDGSFNFKLFGEGMGSLGGIIGTHYGDPMQQRILEHLESMDARIAGLEGSDDDGKEDNGILGQLTNAFVGMLEEPSKLRDFMGALGMNKQAGPARVQPFQHIPHTVGSVTKASPPPQPTGQAVINETNAERIAQAVETMGRQDPAIVEHLEKLARIADKAPAKFKMLLTLLESDQ